MSDELLIKRITEQLDTGTERLDGATRSRLTQARHRALSERRHHRHVWLWPASGALLATVVAVTVWLGREPAVVAPFTPGDFEMLTESDSIELYQDLEFLQWLEEAEGNGVV